MAGGGGEGEAVRNQIGPSQVIKLISEKEMIGWWRACSRTLTRIVGPRTERRVINAHTMPPSSHSPAVSSSRAHVPLISFIINIIGAMDPSGQRKCVTRNSHNSQPFSTTIMIKITNGWCYR